MDTERALKAPGALKTAEAALLSAILLLAASIRLGPVLASPETRRGGFGPYGDPDLYHALALNLAAGRGFERWNRPTVFRAPGYPAFLAAAYAFLSAGDATTPKEWIAARTAVRALQSLLDVSVCAAAFVIVSMALARAPFPLRSAAALLAALLQALNPYTAHWARTLLTEPLAGFLLAWCVALLCVAAEKDSLPAYASSGALAGALVLTRPEYLPWALAAGALAAAARGRAGRISAPVPFRSIRGIARALAFLACLSLIVAPWTYRNYRVFGKIIPAASGSVGELLHRGSFEGSYPWNGWAWCPPGILSGPAEAKEMRDLYAAYIRAQSTAGDEVFRIDDAFKAKALKRIREKPAECAKAWIANFPRLWYQRPIDMFADREPGGGPLLAAIVLACAGVLLCGFKNLPVIMAASVPAYLCVLYLPMHIEARYSTPATPLLAALAAFALGQALLALIKAASAFLPRAYRFSGTPAGAKADGMNPERRGVSPHG
jgi:hypothetical protein